MVLDVELEGEEDTTVGGDPLEGDEGAVEDVTFECSEDQDSKVAEVTNEGVVGAGPNAV